MTIRGPLAGILAGLIAAGSLAAQDDEQQAFIDKRDKKLQSAFLQNADWIMSFAEAKAVAKETGKPIFAYFTRSYAR